MSMILKGIDLPKEGEWLEVIIKPTKEAIVDTIRYRDNALLKTEYGSVIQIQKGHGDIKDVGKLESHEEFDGYGFTKSVYADDINDAPTILEEEV